MPFPTVTYTSDQTAFAGLYSNAAALNLSLNNLTSAGALASAVANLLASDGTPGSVSLSEITGFGAAGGYIRSNGSAWVRVSGVAAADVTAGTFGSTFADTGTYTFAASVAVTTSLTSAAGFLALGAATLPTTGAIRVNAATYSDVIMDAVNSTRNLLFRLVNGSASVRFGGGTSTDLLLTAGGSDRWLVSEVTSTARLVSQQATAEITGGSTTLRFNTIGSGTSATLSGRYWDTSGTPQYRNAWSVTNANGFGTLQLMPDGGNVVVGGTAAGATASGTLALAAGTSPSATVDLVHLYGLDISAGNRSLAIYQECPTNAAAAVASTHRLPVTINGTQYALLLTTVLS